MWLLGKGALTGQKAKSKGKTLVWASFQSLESPRLTRDSLPSLAGLKITEIHSKKGPGICSCPPQRLGASTQYSTPPDTHGLIYAHAHTLPMKIHLHTHTHATKPSTHTSSPLTQAHYTHAHTAAHSYLHTHTPRANSCCPRLFALQWFLLQSLKPLPLPQREVVGGRERRRGKGSQKGSVTAEATQQSQEDELSPYV